ncbi:hypothetical protein Tco_0016882 [Tanacetum coccineum]
MTSVHNSSGLKPQCQMTSVHNSSGLKPQCQMASDHVSSDPAPQCSTMVLEQDSLSPGPQSQENVPQVAETATTSNELELLYSPMFSELLNGTSHVVSSLIALRIIWRDVRRTSSFDDKMMGLVDRPLCKNVINLKWLWKNKRDEENTVIHNKSRLVARGYAQKGKELIF